MSRHRIERLSTDVINRIAAGEVVQRPSAALKELLENALDAGSTSIQVLAADGGLDVLQVTDDGDGIHTEDLPLVCERYATSKLRSFDDLKSIASFGFRGEALASISYVARVSVTTMRRDAASSSSSSSPSQQQQQQHAATAWQCKYADGRVVDGPTPCAGNPGTTIRVESMFYNSAVRRRSLNRAAEEYSRIVGVVARYALAFPKVSFSCRKLAPGGAVAGGGSNAFTHAPSPTGNVRADVFFPKQSTVLANIRLFHGASVASHLYPIAYSSVAGDASGEESSGAQRSSILALKGEQGSSQFCFSGYVSDVTLTVRKHYICLFVNNRLVESSAVKRALDGVYHAYLTGGNKYFVVLNVTVPQDRVDVNVHPTKHEVCLLDEEAITFKVAEATHRALTESAAARQIALARPEAQRYGGSGSSAMGGGSASGGSRVAQLPSAVSSAAAVSGGKGIVVAPSTIVRVEQQRGAMEQYLRPKAEIASQQDAAGRSSQSTLFSQHVDVDEAGEEDESIWCTESLDASCALKSQSSVGKEGENDIHERDELKEEEEEQKQRRLEGLMQLTDAVFAVKRCRSEESSSEDEKSEDKTPLTLADQKQSIEDEAITVKREGGESNGKIGKEDDSDESSEESDDDDDNLLLEFKRRRMEVLGGAISRPPPKETGSESDVEVTWRSIPPPQQTPQPAAPSTLRVITAQDASPLPDMPAELEDVTLTSISEIIADIAAESSGDVKSLFDGMIFVGIVDAYRFLAQSGTTLYLIDTLRFVSHVVSQRIFLRWGVSSLPSMAQYRLATPAPIHDLLWLAHNVDNTFALASIRKAHHEYTQRKQFHEGRRSSSDVAMDAATVVGSSHQQQQRSVSRGQPSDLILREPLLTGERLIPRMLRRLCQRREMLSEYFAIDISHDGRLLALPLPLGPSWPPAPRAVPLFLWRLAAEVNFHNEKECFKGITRLIADVLYGMCVHAEWEQRFPVSSSCTVAVHDAKEEAADEEKQTSDDACASVSASSQRGSAGNAEGAAASGPSSSGGCCGCCGSSGKDAERADPSAVTRSQPAADVASSITPPSGSAGVQPLPAYEDAVRFGLLPCVAKSKYFLPSLEHLTDGTLCSVVTVEDLYKVFERC